MTYLDSQATLNQPTPPLLAHSVHRVIQTLTTTRIRHVIHGATRSADRTQCSALLELVLAEAENSNNLRDVKQITLRECPRELVGDLATVQVPVQSTSATGHSG